MHVTYYDTSHCCNWYIKLDFVAGACFKIFINIRRVLFWLACARNWDWWFCAWANYIWKMYRLKENPLMKFTSPASLHSDRWDRPHCSTVTPLSPLPPKKYVIPPWGTGIIVVHPSLFVLTYCLTTWIFPFFHKLKGHNRLALSKLSSRKQGFDGRPLLVGFVVGKVAVRNIYLNLRVLWCCSLLNIIPPMFHIHTLCIFRRRYIPLLIDSVVK
jgi:hypothetical protein